MTNGDNRMGAFDAVMWGVEDDPLLRSVILVAIVLDRDPGVAVGRERVERLTRLVPQLRQRVVGNSYSLVPPRWESDPHFDLGYHLRWVALPARHDGGPAAGLAGVLRIAEQLAEQNFDRDRPLWEMTLVSGLPDGRAALLVKIHHAITDGVGGMLIAASLFDLDSAGPRTVTRLPPVVPSPVLDPTGRVLAAVEYESRTLTDELRAALSGGTGLALRAARNPWDTVRSTAGFAASVARLLAPASTPLSPVMVERSLSIRLDTIEMPLTDLQAAGVAAGGTINDTFIAAVAGGFREFHLRHDAVPAAVRLNMPVNLSPGESGSGPASGARPGGNGWVPARFALPLDEPDLLLRIQQLHPLLRRARNEPALGVSGQVFRVLSTLPRPVTTAVAGALMKGTDVAATNLPGPNFPVYLAGARVLQLIPFAPKAGAAVNIALLSYNGNAQIGVNIDRAAVPEAEELMACLRRAFDEVSRLAAPQRGQPTPATKRIRRKATPR